ncbi:hypothetical protein [Hansschlegelia zhihuaiae]|uniref:Uncharacterized protein n=1 Tax=Hansschlegelia zhihuaiae TaxID=405005 RepID=A0A4Q0M415_9HYPH|nr:hypothetical protein [Hansschlegelia zhihuaiae]RXF67671.1 hypothetical protein EK403_20925 [Hansschlegelia zhihuaiae]
MMDQVVVELLKYGLPGLGLLALGWAYLQERADRKAAENRLIEYLSKDRDAVLAVSHSAVAAIGEATQAHAGTSRTLEAMTRAIERGVYPIAPPRAAQ